MAEKSTCHTQARFVRQAIWWSSSLRILLKDSDFKSDGWKWSNKPCWTVEQTKLRIKSPGVPKTVLSTTKLIHPVLTRRKDGRWVCDHHHQNVAIVSHLAGLLKFYAIFLPFHDSCLVAYLYPFLSISLANISLCRSQNFHSCPRWSPKNLEPFRGRPDLSCNSRWLLCRPHNMIWAAKKSSSKQKAEWFLYRFRCVYISLHQ